MSAWSFSRRERALLYAGRVLSGLSDAVERLGARLTGRAHASVIRRTTLPCDTCGSRKPVGAWVDADGRRGCAAHGGVR